MTFITKTWKPKGVSLGNRTFKHCFNKEMKSRKGKEGRGKKN
jgi:hypothetical protein